MSETDWRRSWWRRVQVAAIADLGYPLVALLGRTLRWRVEGLEHLAAVAASGRPPVMGFWHGRILPATYYFRRRGIVVIVLRRGPDARGRQHDGKRDRESSHGHSSL